MDLLKEISKVALGLVLLWLIALAFIHSVILSVGVAYGSERQAAVSASAGLAAAGVASAVSASGHVEPTPPAAPEPPAYAGPCQYEQMDREWIFRPGGIADDVGAKILLQMEPGQPLEWFIAKVFPTGGWIGKRPTGLMILQDEVFAGVVHLVFTDEDGCDTGTTQVPANEIEHYLIMSGHVAV